MKDLLSRLRHRDEEGVVQIKATTVGDLGGARVGVSNIWEAEYEGPDGNPRTGLSAEVLALDGDGTSIRAGVGSVLTVEGTRWEVTAVSEGPRGRGKGAGGTVSFRRLG